MELLIGEKIYKLRKEKGITQEQLANALGVSAAAVSKWETGNTYPDITLLPSLARYFDTSIDELLSFTKEISNEDVLIIEQEFENIFENEGINKAIDYLEKNIKEYPNSDYLKYRGAGILQMHSEAIDSKEEMDKMFFRAIELAKTVSESKNKEFRNVSYALLSTLYVRVQDFDNAEEALKKIPKTDVNPDGLLPTIYFLKGNVEEAEKLYQMNLFKSITSAISDIKGMVNVASRENDYKRALVLLETEKKLIELFHLEDVAMLSHYMSSMLTYSKMKDIENTLDAMEQYLHYMNTFYWDNYDISKNEFFNKNKTGLHVWKSTGVMKIDLLEDLKGDPRFDFVRNTERYNRIIKAFNKVN